MISAQRLGEHILNNKKRWVAIQRAIGNSPADGLPMNGFLQDMEEHLGITKVTPAPKKPDVPYRGVVTSFPDPDYHSMVAYYGRPGDESQLVRCPFPYPMRLYTRSAPANVRSHRCHHKVKASLEAVLELILETFGKDGIREHGLDVFGGIYNNRSVRHGRAKSKHAWGVAIDLNPNENRNRQKWHPAKTNEPGWANMPVEAVECFESFGWKSGGRAWGRDAMHFQATR